MLLLLKKGSYTSPERCQKVVDSPSSKQGANEYSSSHITHSK